MDMSEECILEIKVKVRYTLHADDSDIVLRNVEKELDRAIQDGMLTGATDAEVDEYSAGVDAREVW